MVHRLDLNFEDYSDFEDFISEHKSVINNFSDEKEFADRVKMHVKANRQLPEFFEFTPTQFREMLEVDSSGIKSLVNDDRVDYSPHNEK